MHYMQWLYIYSLTIYFKMYGILYWPAVKYTPSGVCTTAKCGGCVNKKIKTKFQFSGAVLLATKTY